MPQYQTQESREESREVLDEDAVMQDHASTGISQPFSPQSLKTRKAKGKGKAKDKDEPRGATMDVDKLEAPAESRVSGKSATLGDLD